MATKKQKQVNDLSYTSLIDMIQDFNMELTPAAAVRIVNQAYKNPLYLCERGKIVRYRKLDLGIAQEDELKNIFDPKGKNQDVKSGEFMNTDWKPCPMVQSLNRITRGYIIDSMSDIRVDGIDRLSIDKKAQKRQQEIAKKYAVDLINFINSLTNDMPISQNTNLEEYASNDPKSQNLEQTASLLEQIKSELDDDMDFALLADVGALKDGVEASHEVMIRYYLDSLMFKERVSYELVSDIMKIRTFCYRFYTSAMDGTPQVQYIDPMTISTSPFKERDGRDLDYWYQEFIVTWSDYMKMIGGKLDIEKNKKIYEANRAQYYPNDSSYPAWNDTPQFFNALFNTKINLGYFELKKHVKDKNSGTYYDVWKKFYYLPLQSTSLSLNEDFILDLGDLQDMTRHGAQLQYAKPSLVIYRDSSVASWYDIQEPDLLRLNVLYNQYLNTAASIIPRGVVFAEETLTELVEDMLNAQEEYMNENNTEMTNRQGVYQKLLSETIRKFKSRGQGLFKKRKGDDDEEPLDNPTSQISHSLYEDLTQLVTQMMGIYNQMITSLGTNPILLGQAPKQHQTLKGIEIANQSGLSMLQEMISMNEFSVTEFGHRMIWYDKLVSREFTKSFEPKSPRAAQMKAIIGVYGTAWLEIFRDMYIQDCTMRVEVKPTEEQRIMLFDYTSTLEQKGLLPIGTSLMVQEIKNYKIAKLYIKAQVKKAERIAIENQMAMQQQQAQMQQEAMAMQQQQAQQQQAETAGYEARLLALENQLKQEGMSKNIAERGANKERENEQKAQLDLQKKIAESELPY